MSNLKGSTKKDTKMRIRAFPVSIYRPCEGRDANCETRVPRMTGFYASNSLLASWSIEKTCHCQVKTVINWTNQLKHINYVISSV